MIIENIKYFSQKKSRYSKNTGWVCISIGDLFISRKNNENASIRFEQSIIHKEYIEHLFEKFSYLCTTSTSIKTAERKAFNTSSVYFTTRQLTSITELHKLFYVDKSKIVPLNIGSLLTAKSLLSDGWWR